VYAFVGFIFISTKLTFTPLPSTLKTEAANSSEVRYHTCLYCVTARKTKNGQSPPQRNFKNSKCLLRTKICTNK